MLGEIVILSEMLVLRHFPTALSDILATLAQAGAGHVNQLNTMSEHWVLPCGKAMLGIWLGSFDKPALGRSRIQDEIFGPSYVIGSDYWSHKYWLPYSLDRVRACIGFSGALMDLVAIILPSGSLTCEMPN